MFQAPLHYLFSENEGNNIFFTKHSLLDSQCSVEQWLNCVILFQDLFYSPESKDTSYTKLLVASLAYIYFSQLVYLSHWGLGMNSL